MFWVMSMIVWIVDALQRPQFVFALLACLGQQKKLRDTAVKGIPTSHSTNTLHHYLHQKLVIARCHIFAATRERRWERTCWDVVLLLVISYRNTYTKKHNDLCYKN